MVRNVTLSLGTRIFIFGHKEISELMYHHLGLHIVAFMTLDIFQRVGREAQFLLFSYTLFYDDTKLASKISQVTL